MRVTSLVAVLSTLFLPNLVVAEPIPIRASRSELVAEVDTQVLKREEDKVFGKTGWGARYWAWARVAYDPDWNESDDTQRLRYTKQETKDGKQEDRKWKFLEGNDDIYIRGATGANLKNAGFMWTDIETTQHATVAIDKKNKEIVVSYQGTDNFWHLLQDLKANKYEVPNVAGEVHLGFGECFETLEGDTTRFLRTLLEVHEYQHWPISFVGHSLGGATALVAAAFYTKYWPSIKSRTWVFTYGSPNAGTEHFQHYLQRELGPRMYNFRHIDDPVPQLPAVTKKFIWGNFANPASRYVFEPDSDKSSWFDTGLWQPVPVLDHYGQGYLKTAYQGAKAKWDHGVATHTGYFQDDMMVKATHHLPDELIGEPDHSQQKRDAPSATDLNTGLDLMENLANGRELKDLPRSAPTLIWRMAPLLKFEGDEESLWKTLTKLSSVEQRIAFLHLVFLEACGLA